MRQGCNFLLCGLHFPVGTRRRVFGWGRLATILYIKTQTRKMADGIGQITPFIAEVEPLDHFGTDAML